MDSGSARRTATVSTISKSDNREAYIESLEQKVKALEARIRELEASGAQSSQNNGSVPISSLPPEIYDMVCKETFREPETVSSELLHRYLEAPENAMTGSFLNIPYEARVANLPYFLMTNTFSIKALSAGNVRLQAFQTQAALQKGWKSYVRTISASQSLGFFDNDVDELCKLGEFSNLEAIDLKLTIDKGVDLEWMRGDWTIMCRQLKHFTIFSLPKLGLVDIIVELTRREDITVPSPWDSGKRGWVEGLRAELEKHLTFPVRKRKVRVKMTLPKCEELESQERVES